MIRWFITRDEIIKRDLGCDLGVFGIYIYGPIYVHHINPITEHDIEVWSDVLFDPENPATGNVAADMMIKEGLKYTKSNKIVPEKYGKK